jgi:hypothetical protein
MLGGLYHRLQFDAAVGYRCHRRGDDMSDLLVDAGKLGRQVGFAVVDQLHRGVDLHAQLGDPPIDKAAQVVDLRADAGAHQLFEALGGA